jgi:hypothetical protein
LVWIVSGTNGENRIEARGASQDESWCNAVLHLFVIITSLGQDDRK